MDSDLLTQLEVEIPTSRVGSDVKRLVAHWYLYVEIPTSRVGSDGREEKTQMGGRG